MTLVEIDISDIINLVRAHAEKDEDWFKETACKIAEDIEKQNENNAKSANFIKALVGAAPIFVPQPFEPCVCYWKPQCNGEEDYYETSCGNYSFFELGDIEDNKFKFCPYCGKPIKDSREFKSFK